jgi:hypothetical protein
VCSPSPAALQSFRDPWLNIAVPAPEPIRDRSGIARGTVLGWMAGLILS